MRVYISGPISGLTQEEYQTAFGLAEARLLDMGYDPVNPTKIAACETADCNGDERKPDGTYLHSYRCYMIFDIIALMECDGIFMLEGWRDSRGAVTEWTVGNALGLTLLEFDAVQEAIDGTRKMKVAKWPSIFSREYPVLPDA